MSITEGKNEAGHVDVSGLAHVSRYGGWWSVLSVQAMFALFGYCTLPSLVAYAFGTLGTMILLIGVSVAVERAIRPMVLQSIGWLEFQSLRRDYGHALASYVAKVYASGNTLTESEFIRLAERYKDVRVDRGQQ